MNDQAVIVTEGLTRTFGPKTAVGDLTLEVRRGEVFGFLGHNGAGKTTTVRLLNGLLTPSKGTARVLGLNPIQDGPALRSQTGVLTETPSLDERLTGRENLSIYADLYGVPRSLADRRVEEMLASFDLAEVADDKAGGYSRGMKLRLALARAFLHEPVLIFLDEPTAGLDPVAARHVHDMIQNLSRERQRTIFLCTHNLVEAQQLCDRVAVLQHGQLLAVGSPAELAGRYGQATSLVLEVAPECIARALDALSACPGFDKVGNEGPLITVQGASRTRVPELIQALVLAQVPVYRVMPQEASLEDVYFALQDNTAFTQGSAAQGQARESKPTPEDAQ